MITADNRLLDKPSDPLQGQVATTPEPGKNACASAI